MTPSENRETPSEDPVSAARKPYEKPTLECVGDIVTLTQVVAGPPVDGGGGAQGSIV